MTVAVRADEDAVATFAAERLTTVVDAAVAARGSAMVCLTGGRTPRRLYELLADERRPWRTRITWPRVHLCWGDERHVPPGHPDSNFGMAHRALLSRVPVAGQHVHRIRAELPDIATAARDLPENAVAWPVQLLRAAGDRVEWIMDAAAAARRPAAPRA